MGIVVYTTENCRQCKMTKRFLDSSKIEYDTVDLSNDQDARQMLKDAGYSSAPVTVVDGDLDNAIVGFAVSKLRTLTWSARSY